MASRNPSLRACICIHKHIDADVDSVLMCLQAPWLTETIIRLAADPGDFERWVAARDAEMDGCSVGYRAWRQKVKKKKEERRQDKLLFGDILNRRKDGVVFEDEACDGANGAGGFGGGAEQAWTAAEDVSGNRSVEVEVGGQRTRIDVGVRDSTSSDDSGWEGLGLDSNATSDDSSEVLRQITSLKHGDDEQLALLEIEAQKRRQYRQWKLRKKQRAYAHPKHKQGQSTKDNSDRFSGAV